MNAQVLRCYSRILCEGAGLKWNRWEYIIPAHGVSTQWHSIGMCGLQRAL